MSDHWKSLADLLGAPGLSSSNKSDLPSSNPTPAQTHSAPTPVVNPVEESAAEPEPPTIVEQPVPKPRKRSSWEALANLFNISIDPEPKAAPVQPEPPREVPAPVSQPRAELFKADEPPAKNNALTEMFGEVPSQPHEQWGKPRRVVDDLGWDDDDAPVSRHADSETPAIAPRAFAPIDDDSDEELSGDEEPTRRSSRRRRRRRGRGGRDEAAGSDELIEKAESVSDSDFVVAWGDSSADDDSDLIVEVSDSEASEDDELPEARTRRRRRRRGGRRRGTEGERSDEVGSDSESAKSAQDPFSDIDLDEPYDGDARDESDSKDGDEPRRRRRRRTRSSGRTSSESGDAESDVASDLDDGEGVEAAADRHRNIPTWEDSLNSLIESNIENHRRNESRGGGPRGGGGRGRGRR